MIAFKQIILSESSAQSRGSDMGTLNSLLVPLGPFRVSSTEYGLSSCPAWAGSGAVMYPYVISSFRTS